MSQRDPQILFQLTLQELINLPAFSKSKVIAGALGLNHAVSGINLSDKADCRDCLSANELLLTECSSLSGDNDALREFIPMLSDTALAGVCIKPSIYLDNIPQYMIDAANERSFALIELPDDANFSILTKSVSDLILKRQTDFLKRVLSANDLLIKLIVDGATLDEIASMLCDLVETPVLIVDSINSRRSLCIGKSARFAFADLDSSDESIARMITENSYVQPLYVDNRTFGYLYIYNVSQPLSPLNQSIIERISQTIPLEIARERSIRETENVHFKDFIIHLLSDKIIDNEKEAQRAKSFGINTIAKHIVMRVIIKSSSESGSQYTSMLQKTFLYNEVKSALQNMGITIKVAKANDRYIILLSTPENCDTLSGLNKKIKNLFSRYSSCYSALTLLVGYGRICTGLCSIAQSGDDAQTALRVCETMHKNDSGIVGFDEIGLFRLIYAHNPENETLNYINETIGPLISPEKSRSAELLATLESYFEHFGNLKRVSEETFTHYNTVVYRLKSIKEVTGYDVRDSGDRFKLEVALKLYRLLSLEKSNAVALLDQSTDALEDKK